MSDRTGTHQAVAATRRQRFGVVLLMVAFFLIFLATWGSWIFLWSLTGGFSDPVPGAIAKWLVPLTAWAFAEAGGAGGVYAIPPLQVIVVGVLAWLLSATIVNDQGSAIARAKGRRFMSRRSIRDEARNLKLQLRQRGRAGLFVRGRAKFVRLGLVLIGAGVVLATVLLYPAIATGTSGARFDVHWGLPMWLCAVASPMAILGGLLVLPFGPEDEVVIDAAGNLSGAAERVVQPPQVSQPQSPAPA